MVILFFCPKLIFFLEELVTDMKILSQEFSLDARDILLTISDLQKSFSVDIKADGLTYKKFTV